MTIKNRLLLITIPLITIAIAGIYVLVLFNVKNDVSRIETENTRNLLNLAMQSIKNQYNSLEFHKNYSFELRKNERKDIVSIALASIQYEYDKFKLGYISENTAQKRALQYIDKLRYNNGNGYIWINNTERPIPRIILHPIYPEFNNKISSNPIFFTSIDSVNIPKLALDLCEKQGSGFIEYSWTKPENKKLIGAKPKVSYVELFKPWQWILGTGIYLEDIELEAQKRMEAIITELGQTIGRMSITESGYFFIFNSDKDILMHPAIIDQTPDSSLYQAVKSPLDGIVEAVKSGRSTFEYFWNHPMGDENDFTYKKKVFVEYFEPLDWYVCATIYQEELENPARILGEKILLISVLLLLVFVAISVWLSDSITRPLKNLMNFVINIPSLEQQEAVRNIPFSGSKESRSLSKAIKNMLIAIDNQKNQISKSEEKYRALFYSAGDAVLMLHEDKVIECNERAVNILKGLKEDVIGLSIGDLSPKIQPDGKDSKERATQIINDTKKDKVKEFEWVHKSLNGELLHIDVTLSLIDSENSLFLSIWRDVTEKKQAEKKLIESEIQLKAAQKIAKMGHWKLDHATNKMEWSDEVYRIYGIADTNFEITYNIFLDHINHNDRERVKNSFQLSLLTGKQYNITYQILLDNGSKKYVEEQCYSNFDREGKPVSTIGTVQDITERIIAQRKLKESEERYRLLVENNPSVFWILDKYGKFRYVSPNCEVLIGYSVTELYEKGIELWNSRIHKDDYDNFMIKFESLFANGGRIEAVYKIKNINDEWEWIHSVGHKNADVFGEEVVYGVSSNITEKKQTEQRIFQSIIQSEENERSRIAKDLHDGVSPLLSAIKLFTQSMRDSKDKKIKAELSEKISSTIEEAIQTIHEISANLSPHILQNFGLCKAVEAFAGKFLEQNLIQLQIDSEFDNRLPCEIETTLYRISIELLNNTMKHAKAKNINMRYILDDDHIHMNYKDDGVGFEVEKVLKTKKGMGLFNMKNRVTSLNGHIEISSIINQGVNIGITIPLEN